MQFALRVLAKRFPAFLDYWAGREALCGYLPRAAAADALSAISRWTEFARERQARFALFEPHLPAWLPRPDGRLPCVVPVLFDTSLEAGLHELGLGIGRRHLERVHADGAIALVPVLPIPIHQGVPPPLLEAAVHLLERRHAPPLDRNSR